MRDLIKHIQEADVFKPASEEEYGQRKADAAAAKEAAEKEKQAERRALAKTAETYPMYAMITEQDGVDFDMVGEFFYDEDEDEYFNLNGDVIDMGELAEKYRDDNYSTHVGVTIVGRPYIEALKKNLDRLMGRRSESERQA